MAHHQPHDSTPDESAGTGHEHKDIRYRGILIATAILVLVTVAIQLVLGLWMAMFSSNEQRIKEEQTVKFEQPEGQFPDPILQGNPAAETGRYVIEEQKALTSYGWRDQKNHIATIPIDRALQAVAAKGLPVSKTEEPKK